MTPYDLADVVSTMEARTLEKRDFAFPNSLDPLTPDLRTGLIAVGLFAMMSLISVSALLVFITHRLISWRRHYKEYVGYNQYVVLIYNLLIADLQQSIAFSISFHWLRINKIIAPTAPCFIQAWFLQIGDVASGFFVLAIAIHTWLGVVKGYKLPYKWFVASILIIWSVALLLTLLGPAIHQERYFARAGGWCWVSEDYQDERLWLHYLWIFIIEFGTIIIYAHIFIHLRGRIRGIITNDTSKLTRANKFMILYPLAYVILTLPIAVGRMIAMTGKVLSDIPLCVVGSLLTSCGWIDALLYTMTRKVLVSGDLGTGNYDRTVTANLTNAARPGDAGQYGLQSMHNKETLTSTARTVTIVGGSNSLSRIPDPRRGRNFSTRSRHEDTLLEDSPERMGSQDSIMKPLQANNSISVTRQTDIQVESADNSFDLPTPQSKEWGDNEYNRRS
ncbi:hypothetical protein EJ02DRAFT_365677 [Clathrospora elynae]|uniref:Uncharacterized protein n=1 Tax=Clathrospora elynae TaxID=706981 RepID=A0A6A5T6N8_9PLEO|nr:hypothetical protein EJ02DRAFT_365677 [Clathrospora elynae]